MKVRELIEQLKELDPEAPVLVDYEGMLVRATRAQVVVASTSSVPDNFHGEDGFHCLADFLTANWIDEEDKVGAFEGVEVGR